MYIDGPVLDKLACHLTNLYTIIVNFNEITKDKIKYISTSSHSSVQKALNKFSLHLKYIKLDGLGVFSPEYFVDLLSNIAYRVESIVLYNIPMTETITKS